MRGVNNNKEESKKIVMGQGAHFSFLKIYGCKMCNSERDCLTTIQ